MPNRINPPLPSQTLDHSRALRHAMTDAECRLSRYLRGGRLIGHKFRRQHPIPPFIVDFCCVEARLIVELDGSQHSTASDDARTRRLEAQGWRVVRFWDHDVSRSTDAVLEAIVDTLGDRTPTPTPLPTGEGP